MLETPRLVLLPLSRAVLKRRSEADSFTLSLPWPGEGRQDVQFPAEWPGDPLPLFPLWLASLPGDEKEGSFVAVTREGVTRDVPTAVGMLGSKGSVSVGGELEIGYGFNPGVWGQGYATEAVHALTVHLLTQPRVRTVTARTVLGNRASERVLQKIGFARMDRRWDEEDGAVTLWAVES